MNGGPSMAFSGVFVILKSYMEPATPVNGGLMRAVELISPERSFLNAQRPAPVAGYSEVGFLVQSCIIGLLGQIMPGKIGAPPESGANHTFSPGGTSLSRSTGYGTSTPGADGRHRLSTTATTPLPHTIWATSTPCFPPKRRSRTARFTRSEAS